MARMDEQIKKDVVDELYWDDRVDATKVNVEVCNDIVRSLEARSSVYADDVNVRVRNGHVTLTGTVPSWAARVSAHDAAAYSAGSVDVENRNQQDAQRHPESRTQKV